MNEIPQKSFYKINEVCQYTDTQPYVVRFWESEFPQLAPEKSRSGQPVYTRGDIDLILRIKQLLYDEEFSLEDARRQLSRDKKRGGARKGKASAAKTATRRKPPRRESKAVESPSPAAPPASEADVIPRTRYNDAVDEIAHLRLKLQELETALRKAENESDAYRQRCEKAAERLEGLLERLV
jgi:DNA-binding transcriptional MerR regulator